ncbi:sterol desaturase family protein [Casimicrobium huifangae]|jgi:sterol desaturase/sphingolipid hydroxylase (fatty acid hydroxylase superfamily)|uniref:sterol desaturase family protein n=1 Tax=Casimicrobium huifangae TaxID=2591109 RepID=UPI0012EC657C|nr:sterol desaturase family protein [Casimicrobium huifangae]
MADWYDAADHAFEAIVGWVYSTAVDPLVYSFGLMSWAERAFDGTSFLVAGVLQVIATALICIPLERLAPVQVIAERRQVRTDVIFTLVNKLGLIPLFTFAALLLLLSPLEASARLHGYAPWSLEDFWPGLAGNPALSLLLYVIVLDFAEYWRHRLQHRLDWWWQLHALHHAQRDMTFWTDDRNHIVDELLAALWMATVALAIGVPPQQFPLVLFVLKLIESLSHANLRWSFGPLKYLLVSPQFHRVHHGISIGHEGRTQGVNFGVVFTIWDKLFGTADFRNAYPETGVRDQLDGRNYGTGFWEAQWLGFSRLKQHFWPR